MFHDIDSFEEYSLVFLSNVLNFCIMFPHDCMEDIHSCSEYHRSDDVSFSGTTFEVVPSVPHVNVIT